MATEKMEMEMMLTEMTGMVEYNADWDDGDRDDSDGDDGDGGV